MSIVSMLFEQKKWLPQDVLSYKVTGKPNSAGVAWVYKTVDPTVETPNPTELTRDFFNKDYSPSLANGTLLAIGNERRYQKDWNSNYQYFREITKCPDYPMVVGDWIAESDITKIDS